MLGKLSVPVGWLVVFGFNGPLKQYFSKSDHLQKRGRERKKRIDESKNVQTTPIRTYCKCSRPLPYCNPNSRTPQHWKFTQHHRTTRPPLQCLGVLLVFFFFFFFFFGGGGGGRVVRWCWVNFDCRGVLLIWIIVGQGHNALAVGAGGGCSDIFSLVYHFSFPSPSGVVG